MLKPYILLAMLGMGLVGAVRLAAVHTPDLAFVDAWLVGGGAEAVANRLKTTSPGTMVVALASAKEIETVLRLRAAGAAGCYEKETLSSVLPGILASVRCWTHRAMRPPASTISDSRQLTSISRTLKTRTAAIAAIRLSKMRTASEAFHDSVARIFTSRAGS